MPVLIAKIAVSAATYWIDRPYDYLIPQELGDKLLKVRVTKADERKALEINLVCSALLAVVAWVLVRINPLWLLGALALSWLVSIASGAISLWVDAVRPQLTWASEMEAIKKNFNQVFGMLLWVVLVALCVIPAVFLWKHGSGITMLGIAGVALAEMAVSLWLLFRQAEKHAVLRI